MVQGHHNCATANGEVLHLVFDFLFNKERSGDDWFDQSVIVSIASCLDVEP